MAISRYDPFTRLVTLRDAVDRMFDETFGRGGMGRMSSGISSGMLPMDLYERQDELVLTMALPGARPEDVDISLSGDTLTIRATIHGETENEQSSNWNWYLHEIDHGTFTRTVSLPFPVAHDRADARFENGMLHLTMPKSEEARPKRIQVQGGGQSRQIGVGSQSGQQSQMESGQQSQSGGGQYGQTGGGQTGSSSGGQMGGGQSGSSLGGQMGGH